MQRTVGAHLSFTTVAQTKVAMAIAVARNPGYDSFDEDLVVTADGVPLVPRELLDGHGGRFHAIDLAEPAHVEVSYTARVGGHGGPEPVDEMELIRYVRPSRYAESDRLLPTSYANFGSLGGVDLVQAVRDWVHGHLAYVSGSSRGTDGAVETLLHRRGVCRDFAHLAIAFLRAKDVPARLAAVYAPGLAPMDFHAVAEAYVEGEWHVVDPTGLAPRASMLRITAGRDSADTAFLSTVGGRLTLKRMSVTAEADALPAEDPAALIRLA